jgi:hypothetical protein
MKGNKRNKKINMKHWMKKQREHHIDTKTKQRKNETNVANLIGAGLIHMIMLFRFRVSSNQIFTQKAEATCFWLTKEYR